MKMVKHMALPFVTICALVSVTVMAYEANYAGNPVTVKITESITVNLPVQRD